MQTAVVTPKKKRAFSEYIILKNLLWSYVITLSVDLLDGKENLPLRLELQHNILAYYA